MNHDAEYVHSGMLSTVLNMMWCCCCFGLNLQTGADPDLSYSVGKLSHSENLISVNVSTASIALNGSGYQHF